MWISGQRGISVVTVEQAPTVHSQYERIIRGYTGLGSGDIAILKVALQNRRNKRQVVSLSDDHLVLLIAHRLNLKVMMLPDFVEVMYKQQVITKTVAREMLYEMSPRYGSGIINHSLSKI
ncbi:hypothetical protein HYR99_17410 [Candidatus Poribacteria bacterium]|nr:hypothetical protein [Candidatus Poribacteria bacterium]